MSLVEIIAALLVLVNVALVVVRSIWCWPVGAVAVTLYGYVFWRAQLYANMGLQAVYLALQFYGWYQWLYGGEGHTKLPIRRVGDRRLMICAGLGLVGTVVLGTFLKWRTDAALPYWDSAATAFSLVAQWMLAKKYLQNWLFWIGVNIIYVGMFITQAMIPSAVLYGILLVMAVMGYWEWLKSLHETEPVLG